MAKAFSKIAIFAKHNSKAVADTLQALISFLNSLEVKITIEEKSSELLLDCDLPIVNKDLIAQKQDLVIVVGGDGSLLNAARSVINYDVPVLGINRGNLGFLADITPQSLNKQLTDIFAGKYKEEKRTLITGQIIRGNKEIASSTALNDIVLYTGKLARMIEFEVYINKQFMLSQHADGLITATPTGSTAYSLSGGGPILYPTLPAITMVPMLPHTLSSRPVVISDDSEIELIISASNTENPRLSFDGQVHFDLEPNDKVIIAKHKKTLRLLHPEDHNYFSVLRKKLGWHSSTSRV